MNWFAALLVFAAVALAVGSGILLWEGIRAFRRQQAAARALKRVHSGEPVAEEAGKRAGILREDDELPGGILGFILVRLPHQADTSRLLEQAGVGWSVGTYLLVCIGAAAGLGLGAMVATGSGLAGAVLGAVGLFLPRFYLNYKRAKRVEAFEEAFPDALDLMTRSVRAGHAFQTGVQVVAEEAEEPVRAEFKQIHEENRFGLPLEESLLAFTDRVDLVDARLFVTSILIQRESGGNLAEKLANLSNIIRARFKFRRQVKIHTAHGRMTGTVIALAPVVVGILLYLVNPDYMEPLFMEPAGRLMLLGAFVSMTVGFFIIRRITDIEF
jgi:tight adherence protein B